MSCHIMQYLIISYHIISYHIILYHMGYDVDRQCVRSFIVLGLYSDMSCEYFMMSIMESVDAQTIVTFAMGIHGHC